jgi:hypothetical protein
MSGWAPLFPSLTTGTLCGRWPDIGLWPIVLSLKDRNGIVDVTPDYLSRVTGLELEAVVSCMARFCEPDPYSRSGSESGRRLVLVDPGKRNWGWRVVNSGLYRERARMQAKDQVRTETGEDAERKRKDRLSPEVPRSPPNSAESPEVPLSESETKAHKSVPRKRGCRVPEPFPITTEMREWAKAQCPHVSNLEKATDEFVDYWRGVSGAPGVKLDWDGTWRNRLRQLEERSARSNGSGSPRKSEWM